MEKQSSACRLSQLTCTHTCWKNSLARPVLKPACPWNRTRRSESSAQRPTHFRPVPWLPASLAAPGTSAPTEASCSAVWSREAILSLSESGPLLWGGGSDMSPKQYHLFHKSKQLCLACYSFACPLFWFWSPFLLERGTLAIYSGPSLALFWELWCERIPHIAFINMSY